MKYSDFEWIRRVIRSCKTIPQATHPIGRLIYLFQVKYMDADLIELLYEEKTEQILNIFKNRIDENIERSKK